MSNGNIIWVVSSAYCKNPYPTYFIKSASIFKAALASSVNELFTLIYSLFSDELIASVNTALII